MAKVGHPLGLLTRYPGQPFAGLRELSAGDGQAATRTAERLFGWTSAEAVGQHITLIIPEHRRTEGDDVLARIRRREKVDHFETVRLGPGHGVQPERCGHTAPLVGEIVEAPERIGCHFTAAYDWVHRFNALGFIFWAPAAGRMSVK